MGDHQHCGAVVCHFLQQPHDDGSAFGIQISGGFVRYQKFRPFIRARAMLTRLISPPESSFG